MNNMYGVVCATITPLDKNGCVDESSLSSLISYLCESGIHCLYPNGTNGEGILLSEAERKRVAEKVVKAVDKKIPVYIQCGSITTKETVEHAVHAQSIGADGIGIMTPLFFHHDDQALEIYYSSILKELDEDFPVYLYNIPSHTNNDLSCRVVSNLVKKFPNIRGIKYSDSDLMRIQDYLRIKTPEPDVLIGCDSLFFSCLEAGGKGTISGPAMAFNRLFTGLYDAYTSGDLSGAKTFQKRIVEIDRSLSEIPGIPALKYLLKSMGVIKNDACRRPLRELTPSEQLKLDKILKLYDENRLQVNYEKI